MGADTLILLDFPLQSGNYRQAGGIMKFEGPWKVIQFEMMADTNLEPNLKGVHIGQYGPAAETTFQQQTGFPQSERPSVLEIIQALAGFVENVLDSHHTNPGRFACHSVARSNTRAARNSVSSAKAGARSCRPIGRPEFVRPQGMLRPGMPARLVVIV